MTDESKHDEAFAGEPSSAAPATEAPEAAEPSVEGGAESPDLIRSDEAAGAAGQAATVPSAELEALREQLKRTHERLLRTAADLENFKRRSRRELSEAVDRAEDQVVLHFLPVIDNLERAIEHGGEGGPESLASLVDGVRLVHKQLVNVLGRYGIEAITTTGQVFDPQQHEALQQQPSEQPRNTVVAELQKGYVRKGRVVRPAMVVVSGGPAPAAASTETEQEGNQPPAATAADAEIPEQS